MADDKKTTGTTSGRRTRHSARKKEPVTIDMDAKKATDTKAANAKTAKPAPTAAKKPATASKSAPAAKPAAKSTSDTPAKPVETPAGKKAEVKPAPASTPPAQGASKPSVPPVAKTNTTPPAKADASKPVVPVAKAKTDDARSGGAGFGSMIAAALLGGIVSLGGAWALGAFEDDADDLAVLRSQIDERIAAVESSIPTAPDDALTRADVDAAIQAALAARTSDGNPVEPDPRIATMGEELTATQEKLDEIQQAIAAAGSGEGGTADGTALAALAARVADLDGRIASSAAPSVEEIQTIADQAAAGRVETLEGGLDARIAQGTSGALAPVQERIGTIATTVGELSSKLATVETGLTELRGTVESGTADLAARLEQQAATTASQAEALAAQDERMATISEQVADTDPERRAATALALANLRTRIDDGEGYETELALVRRTNSKIDLAPLDATAASGIATLAGLQNRFDAAADAIREAVRPAPEAGVGGLLSNLKSVVKVKPLDGEPGQDLDATLGAIRSALADGDLAAADSAWQSVPEPGQAASKDWHDALVARMKAKNFLSQALASLLEETGG